MNEAESKSNEIFNVPNKISAVRLVMSFVVFALIPLEQYWAALVIFVIAAGTDFLDGWYARKYGMVTQLGRILDPFCDKILICGTFILIAVAMRDRFAWYSSITGILAVIVVGREILVTALRSFIEQSGGDFSASMAGKLKMWFQCFAAGLCLIALAQFPEGSEQDLSPAIFWAMTLFVWLAVLSTLYSGAGYVRVVARKLIGDSAAS